MTFEIDYYDGESLTAAYEQVGGETYLVLGPDEVVFHVQVPDYDSPSNVDRKPLPDEFRTEVAATAIALRAYVDEQLSKKGRSERDATWSFFLSKF